MRISLQWLRELVDLPEDLHTLRETCDIAGLEVAQIENLAERLDGIVAGRVVEATPVEGTKLHEVRVDCGPHGTKTAMCGAPNMTAEAAGRLVATALPGAVIRLNDAHGRPHEVTVEVRTMRGVLSESVLLSERELGLSEDHSGVLFLPDEVAGELAPGAALAPALGDVFIEFELTPDLGRCFSAWGLARELRALFQSTTRSEAIVLADVGAAGGGIPVSVSAPDLCHRYLGAVIRGVVVEPSPAWMQKRLVAGGMRPINNLVDIANYVMLEMGQPLHFFDLERLHGPRVDVREARAGESIVGLDQQTYELSAPMLVIADAQGPVAVAGVIGGADSAVSDATTNVLLEAAHFGNHSVRRTCQSLKLRTDAAERFIKSVDAHRTFEAMRRAVQLTLELCEGATLSGYADEWPVQSEPRTLDLSERDVERLLGIALPIEQIATLLRGFDFAVESVQSAESPAVRVTAPTWRGDVEHTADLIEEVARAFGLNNIPPAEATWAYLDTAPSPEAAADDARIALQKQLADTLCGLGFYEAIHYSLVHPEHNEFGADFGADRSQAALALANPLSSERTVLRTTLAPGLLRGVAENLRYRDGIQQFELGRAYLRSQGADHHEVELVGLVSAGSRRGAFWGAADPGTGIGGAWTLFDLKGIVVSLLARFGLDGVTAEAAELSGLTPGQAMRLVHNGQTVGYLGEVDTPWLDRFEIDRGPVLLAEFRLEPLELARVERVPTFVRLPTQPRVLRDLSVLVPTSVPVGDVLATIRANGGAELVEVELFDRYQGKGVPDGQHSLAAHLAFQHPQRTLQAAEIDERMALIVDDLAKRHGAQLRG